MTSNNTFVVEISKDEYRQITGCAYNQEEKDFKDRAHSDIRETQQYFDAVSAVPSELQALRTKAQSFLKTVDKAIGSLNDLPLLNDQTRKVT